MRSSSASITTLPSRGPGGMTISATPAACSCDFAPASPRSAGCAPGSSPGARAARRPIHSCSAASARCRALSSFSSCCQALALLLQPGRVVALERIAAAALDLQDPAGDVVEEVAVVGHDHHRAGVVVQRVLQPGDAFGVQVVGRLVQQQQVRLLQQQPAQRDAAPLAARQRGDRGVGRRAAQRVQRDVDAPVEVPAVPGVDLRLQVGLLRQQRRSSPRRSSARRTSCEISLNRSSAAFSVGERLPRRSRRRSCRDRAAAPAPGSRRARPPPPRPRRRTRCRCPAMIFISVDLPAPLMPSTPIFTPGRKASVMPLKTSRPPGKALVRSFIT